MHFQRIEKAMKITCFVLACCLACIVSTNGFWTTAANADVVNSNAGGFQIVINQSTELDANKVYAAFIGDIAKWWDPAHTFSGDAKNLSLNFEKGGLLETLPGGGFVRRTGDCLPSNREKSCD